MMELDKCMLKDIHCAMQTRLKEWRVRRGYSLRGLAEESGVHFMSLFKLESGKLDPQLSTLLKLCEALGITLNQLVGVARKPQKGR